MLTSRLIKQLTYRSLIASLLMAQGGHSDTFERPKSHPHLAFKPLQALAKPVNLIQTTKKLDKKKAQNLVWKLPQVQRKAKEIEQLSKGSIRVASIVDSSPTPEAPYYAVRVFENHPDKSKITIYWFRVLSPSGIIEPLDLIQDEYISLKKWNPERL